MIHTKKGVAIGLLLGVVAAIVLGGCSSAERASEDMGSRTANQDKATASAGANPYTLNGDAPLHTAAREPGAQRAVQREATLKVDVNDLDKAEKSMRESVKEAGGYIDHEEGSDLAGDQPTMTLTIKVPEKSFDGLMTGFEALGHRTEKNVVASDLTEQILEREAQLQQLKRDNLVLTKSGTTYNAGFESIKDRLASLTREKEELEGRAMMSTVNLTLHQKPGAAAALAANTNWTSDTWNAAVGSAFGAFRVVGAILIWLLVYSPLWAPAVLLAICLPRTIRRARGHSALS